MRAIKGILTKNNRLKDTLEVKPKVSTKIG